MERQALVDRHGLRVSHSTESEIAQSGAHLLPRIPQLFVTRSADRFLAHVGPAGVGRAGRRDFEHQLAGRVHAGGEVVDGCGNRRSFRGRRIRADVANGLFTGGLEVTRC
ncbi:hypothetical protein HEP84_04520 [Streptomyces sp. RLB1-33]|nr:hypothetical protein [Streptomyces sp. RLB1-33]QIY68634.1 hypothetical protein HEP84_04520 [Streptomyces sp. RLB1-33]